MLMLLVASAANSPSGDIPIWAYVIGALGIGGMITAAITFQGRKRETSGRIDTTEASKLWDEAGVIRGELRDELVTVRKEKDILSGKVDLLNTQMETLRDKHAECQASEAILRRRVDELEKVMERRSTPAKKTTQRRRT